MIAQPVRDLSSRLREVKHAFEQEDAFDVLILLQRLTTSKCEALGLSLGDLSYPERLVSYIMWFHTEVANGLLEQFLRSEHGAYAQEILEALDVIGAASNYAIFECALSAFPLSRPSRDHQQRRGQVARLGRERRLLLAALDRAYAYESEDAPTLTVEYLEAHKANFV